MGESSQLFRLVVVLGVLFLFVGLLIPGADSPWLGFQATLQTTKFPDFVNPFESTSTILMVPTANGINPPTTVVNNANVSNCVSPALAWFGCLVQRDATGSFVSDTTDFQFRVNMTGTSSAAGNLPVLTVRVLIQCRGTPTNVSFSLFNASGGLQFSSVAIACGSGAFGNTTLRNNFDTPHPKVSDFSPGSTAVVGGGPIDVSFINVELIIGGTTECFGADTLVFLGCVFFGFFVTLTNVFAFLINGIIFVGQSFVFFLTVLVAFFSALIGMFAFFFAIPGAPATVQYIISAFFIGMLAYTVFVILKLVRGSSPA